MPDVHKLFEIFMLQDNAQVDMLPLRSLKALSATSKDMRQLVQANLSKMRIRRGLGIHLLGDPSGINTHARWPHLSTLNLSRADFGTADMELLVQGASLPSLQQLDLSYSALGPAAMQHLAHGQWPALACLNLAGTSKREYEAFNKEELVTSCQHLAAGVWTSLTALNFSQNFLDAKGMAELIRGDWPRLRSLDLSRNLWSATHFVAVLAKAHWTAVQDLNLESNQFTEDDFYQLGQLKWAHLTRLNIAHCLDQIDRQVSMKHVAAGCWPQLAALDVSCNRLSAEDVAELVQGHWPALQSLSLAHSGHGITAQLAGSAWTSLQHVDLRGCRLTAKEASLLAGWPHLVSLNLRGCFGYSKSYKLTAAMGRISRGAWPALAALDVRDNRLEVSISELEFWAKLREVKLSGNKIDGPSLLALVGSTSLRTLKLRGVVLSPEDVDCMLQSCRPALDTVHLTCAASQVTEARPSKESWPLHTHLEMSVSIDCATLHSLSEGHWPATALKLTNRAEPITIAAVQELIKWDLSTLDTLSIGGLGIGYADNMQSSFEVLCRANWPRLRRLDISYNSMGDTFVQDLIGGKWPLLETLCLFGNLISGCGVRQLVRAEWPCLSQVQLGPFKELVHRSGQGTEIYVKKLLRAKWPAVSVQCDGAQYRSYDGVWQWSQ